MSRLPILLAAAAVALTLGGCGKKPGFVDPPQGREADRFPQTYPNPATDPKPSSPDTSSSNMGQPAPGIRFP